MNINNITTWSRYDGQSNHSPGADDGAYFPRGTGSFIYQDGLVWGGKVFTNPARTNPYSPSGTQNIRVGGGTYGVGTKAGRIIDPLFGPAVGIGVENPSGTDTRIWRIRRGYYSLTDAQVLRDAASVYEVPQSAVTPTQKAAVVSQYAFDWSQWPVWKGAPYIERNGTPGYQAPPEFSPSFSVDQLVSGNYDEPGVAGADLSRPADQVIWTVYNDLNTSSALSFVGSYPLGLEIQKTVWGYNRTDDLSNVIFNRYKIINKGGVDTSTAPGDQFGAFWIDSMFVCQWSDPDIGNAGDDLIGCDSVLSLGYAYNGSTVDGEYSIFKLPPPAGGYDFLAGPVVPAPGDSAVFDLKRLAGFRNLGMSSFAYFSAGSPYSDPPTGSANYLRGTGRWWKMLRGFAPLGDLTTSDEPYAYPPGGSPSKYPLSGDPTTGTGWLDGLGQSWSFAAGDRRLLMTTGPFSMAPGDTQEVVTALLAALGADRLSSVAELRYVDQYAQIMYTRLFSLPNVPVVERILTFPSANEATIRMIAFDAERAFQSVSVSLLTSAGATVAEVPLFDDGLHEDGSSDDGRYGGTITIARRQAPLDGRVNLVPLAGTPFSVKLDGNGIVTAGEIDVTQPSVVYDNVGQDGVLTQGEFGRIVVTVRNQTPFTLNGVKLSGSSVSVFGGDSPKTLSFNTMVPGAETRLTYDPSNDSTWLEALIPDLWQSSTYVLRFMITDDDRNQWRDSVLIPVSPRTTRTSFWTAGTGPFGGPVSKMIRDSAGRIFSFPGTGAYRSTDAGVTWQRVAGNGMAYVYDAASLPDGTILAAGFRGLFKSVDHGATWSFQHRDVTSALCVDASGAVFVRTNTDDIIRSTDAGVTWTFQSRLPGIGGVLSYGLITDGHGKLFTYSRGEVIRSLDSGKTWAIVFTSGNSGRVLSLSPSQSLFFGTDSALYRSTDLGNSWQQMPIPTSPTRISRLAYGSGGEVYAGAGGDEWFLSTDNGGTWSSGSGMYSRAHTVLRHSGGLLLGAARGTIIRSTDDGATWSESSQGYNALTVNGFVMTGGTVLMATSRGIYRSPDLGITWEPSSSGFSVSSAGGIFAGSDGTTYAWSGSNLYRSVDVGLTWALSRSFVSGDYYETVLAGAAGPAGVAYIGLQNPRNNSGLSRTPSGRVLKTTDAGLSWQTVLEDTLGSNQRVSFLAASSSGAVAAVRSGGLSLSADGGATWADPSYFSGPLAFDPGGTLVAGSGNLFRSSDLGASWSVLQATGLFIGGQGSITFLAHGSSGELLVGTRADATAGTVESGVFRSVDDGESFTNVSAGVGIGSRPWITTISRVPSAVLVGTSGEGLYRSTTVSGVDEVAMSVPSSFRLEQNFPNPFNPSTTIRYDLPMTSRVTLRVFNVLGQLIETIVLAEQSAGSRQIAWNADRHPSGLYIYRLVARGSDGSTFVQAKKMMLVK
jgi:photosystem II stability/assembly factor-like uncharacterized protein